MCAVAAEPPKTLVAESEAEPIHSAIVRKEAVDAGTGAAAARRSREAHEGRSVECDLGASGSVDIDPHDYYSVAPYWWPNPDNPGGPYIRKDGQTNPDRFMSNKIALNAMCDTVFTLGAAAFLLDDPRYPQARQPRDPHMVCRSQDADECAPRILAGHPGGQRWTRRRNYRWPGFHPCDPGDGISGADRRVGSQGAGGSPPVVRRISEVAHREQQRGRREAIRQQPCVLVDRAGGGGRDLRRKPGGRESGIPVLPRPDFSKQIRSDGSAPREEQRTKSLWYSAFNLEAFVTTCRIAQLQGVDLWQSRAQKDATIATVIEYLQPYWRTRIKWKKEQIADFSNEGLHFLAFAGMGLKRPEYVALFRKLERPGGAWMSVVDLVVSRWEAAAHQTRH
jgi:hypothetical protein